MTPFLRQHRGKLLSVALVANAVLIIMLVFGRVKTFDEWVWLDILGEGGSAAMALTWLVLVLKSRPAGRVTQYLWIGLACVFASWWADWLDEFIRLPAGMPLGHWLESAPMPVGLVLLTLGIYHLHQEQLAISARMEKREHGVRDHRAFDKLTPLANADYLKPRLEDALHQAHRAQQPLALIALDLANFRQVNRDHGHAEGDAVLQAVSQLLLLNLRRQDLLCRLAGDRFVIILPHTGPDQARQIATDLAAAVAALAHRSSTSGERLHLCARTGMALARAGEDANELLRRLNLDLAAQSPAILPRSA